MENVKPVAIPTNSCLPVCGDEPFPRCIYNAAYGLLSLSLCPPSAPHPISLPSRAHRFDSHVSQNDTQTAPALTGHTLASLCLPPALFIKPTDHSSKSTVWPRPCASAPHAETFTLPVGCGMLQSKRIQCILVMDSGHWLQILETLSHDCIIIAISIMDTGQLIVF